MSSEYCCYCFKLDKGCMVLGGVTFLISTFMTVTAVTYMALEDQQVKSSSLMHTANITNATHHILNLNLSKPVIDVTLGIILVMGILWILSSVVFIIGIKKNKASCVMVYFFTGTVVSIMFLLSALLELIHKMWPISMATFLFTIIYLHCLTAVYSAYDQLQRGKEFGDQQQLILAEDFDAEYD